MSYVPRRAQVLTTYTPSRGSLCVFDVTCGNRTHDVCVQGRCSTIEHMFANLPWRAASVGTFPFGKANPTRHLSLGLRPTQPNFGIMSGSSTATFLDFETRPCLQSSDYCFYTLPIGIKRVCMNGWACDPLRYGVTLTLSPLQMTIPPRTAYHRSYPMACRQEDRTCMDWPVGGGV